MSFWQLVVLSVLGVLSTVGMTATLGARLRSPERRLVIGTLLVAYIWLTTMSQMWATVSAAYVLRRTAEADGAGQEVQP